jgi:hypothetical protein
MKQFVNEIVQRISIENDVSFLRYCWHVTNNFIKFVYVEKNVLLKIVWWLKIFKFINFEFYIICTVHFVISLR